MFCTFILLTALLISGVINILLCCCFSPHGECSLYRRTYCTLTWTKNYLLDLNTKSKPPDLNSDYITETGYTMVTVAQGSLNCV